uniref:Uncharacterized protein n=1 Tax=Arundo donax TaxID=35708 RepID=A0A0A9GT63_ARUDO
MDVVRVHSAFLADFIFGKLLCWWMLRYSGGFNRLGLCGLRFWVLGLIQMEFSWIKLSLCAF